MLTHQFRGLRCGPSPRPRLPGKRLAPLDVVEELNKAHKVGDEADVPGHEPTLLPLPLQVT